MQKVVLFKTKISTAPYAEFIETIVHMSEATPSCYICFANVHMITECYNDEAFNQIINRAEIVAPDGKPIVWSLNFLEKLHQAKVSGPDIFPDILKEAERSNKSVFFYGSTEDILRKICAKVKLNFPLLKIAGFHAPSFNGTTIDEEIEITKVMNDSRSDLTFVALGCPKQEKWMAAHVGKIQTCMLGVGQAFQIFAGEIQRAPVWMQHSGLEWLFRLLSEPQRLWKRYVFSNTMFMAILLRYFLEIKVFRRTL